MKAGNSWSSVMTTPPLSDDCEDESDELHVIPEVCSTEEKSCEINDSIDLVGKKRMKAQKSMEVSKR